MSSPDRKAPGHAAIAPTRGATAALLSLLLASAPAAAAWAQTKPGADAYSQEAALACVAARYRGEALALQWDAGEGHWELRWITPARSVLRVKVAPGCRWRSVEGVGQVEARRVP